MILQAGVGSNRFLSTLIGSESSILYIRDTIECNYYCNQNSERNAISNSEKTGSTLVKVVFVTGILNSYGK